MKTVMTMLAALALSDPAAAQTTAEKDGLTVEQALVVKSGLEQLGRYDSVDKDGKPAPAYHKFGADTLMLIALNIDLARRLEAQFTAANNNLVMQKSDGSGKVPDERRAEYNVEFRKLLDAPSRVGFYHIKLEDLCLAATPRCEAAGVKTPNAIPAPVLSLIVPIIDR
jgi:hypothetical protein